MLIALRSLNIVTSMAIHLLGKEMEESVAFLRPELDATQAAAADGNAVENNDKTMALVAGAAHIMLSHPPSVVSSPAVRSSWLFSNMDQHVATSLKKHIKDKNYVPHAVYPVSHSPHPNTYPHHMIHYPIDPILMWLAQPPTAIPLLLIYDDGDDNRPSFFHGNA